MTIWEQLKKQAERLGHLFFYVLLLAGGQAVAYLFLYPIIFIYVLCSPGIHGKLSPYIKRRFPDHSWWRGRLDVFLIVLGFGKVLLDRAWLGIRPGAMLNSHIANCEQLDEIIRSGTGAVMVLAHVGTWQNALAHMEDIEAPVHVMIEHDDASVSKHFYQLGRQRPFAIIDVNGFMGGMFEAKTALQKGHIVMIMGDRYKAGSYTQVDFLGRPVRLPTAPYILAASIGVPLVVAFSVKLSMRRHVFLIWDIMHPNFAGKDRDAEISRCAARFAGDLEAYLERHPYQWYNFFDIWQQ